MFSERTNWILEPNMITVLLESFKNQGVEVIDLTASNPTQCAFKFSHADILQAFQKNDNLLYRPSALGHGAARETVAAYYQQQGHKISCDQILLTASTSEAYSFLFRLLTSPGDTVLFPRPSYPLFEYLMGLNDVTPQTYSLVYRDRWQLVVPEFRKAAASSPKAVIVVNPNNPTGSYLTKEEVAVLNKFCQQQKAAIIADEVFFDYHFDDKEGQPSFAGNMEVLTFTLGGISKTLALPQMKIAWIVATGPTELVQEALGRLEVIADTFLSVNTPAQNALPEWLALRTPIQQEIVMRLRRNRDILMKETASSSCRVLSAQGGWYAVLQLPKKISEEEFILKLLKEQHVFVHPGYFFDFADEPYLVLSLLPAEKDFQEGLKRILGQITKINL